MTNNEILLTKEGLEELKAEMENLRVVRRKEVAEKIKAALAFGDISENSEYDEAKNEQADIERRILKIENMIKNAKIIENSDSNGIVNIGSRVKIKDIEFDEIMEYQIVGSAEADPFKDRISNVSPLGKALMGKTEGEVVNVETPSGAIVEYEILGVN
ncbi:transcription elongation factor GreA [Dethiosulfatibacter aminovorans DSM 17477]|uniref:Transcription elongation factor GreA n=1 Tax=Dethiosulfatibacter aminovorans DSM 17477 TaxID=1121476 RepID=A0A1M6MYH8_9FIRM|nr:transcription elongation factor GreA [Dethiosulfatibacter aminovorans]SHJ88551.1 transcription elongation factor GreA [Dethiosulfatibacter aminovorans DSM 17477]